MNYLYKSNNSNDNINSEHLDVIVIPSCLNWEKSERDLINIFHRNLQALSAKLLKTFYR